MSNRGIFNPGPFYKRPGFLRGAIIFGLLGIFLYYFRVEIAHIIQLIWEPALPTSGEFQQSIYKLLWNGLIFTGCTLLTLILVSQFILPVQSLQQRRKVFERLIAYLLRQHGPAIFVSGGKEIAKKSELLSTMPGVAFVDLTSAVALQKQSYSNTADLSSEIKTSKNLNEHQFTATLPNNRSSQRRRKATVVRISGPGITFTESGETIHGVIDLRPQIRTRRDVHAYTREGIEVTTSITTIFTIGQLPEIQKVVYQGDEKPENLRMVHLAEKSIGQEGESVTVSQPVIVELIDGLDPTDKQEIHRAIGDYRKSGSQGGFLTSMSKNEPAAPYLFDPERIFKAIYASSLDIREDDYKEWTELPNYIASEIFRNMLAGEIYDYLYFPADQRKFPLQDMKSNFALQMRNQGVMAYQFFERKDNIPFKPGQDWLESQFVVYPVQELHSPKILRSRGIKVIHASFSDLTPVSPRIREQLLDNWSAFWDNEAEFARVENELIRTRMINKARIEAQDNLKDQLLKILDSSSLADDALALRMLQALESVAADPKTRQLLPGDTISMLRSIWDWLQTEDQYTPLAPGYGGVDSSGSSVDVIEAGQSTTEESNSGDSRTGEIPQTNGNDKPSDVDDL